MNEWVENYCGIVGAGAKIGTFLVLLVTSHVALAQYKRKCRKEEVDKDIELRKEVRENPSHCRIQILISHRDLKLESLLNRINASDEPCSAQLASAGRLSAEHLVFRQDLDNYLNFLEEVGMMIRRKYFTDEATSGYWDYYFERIGDWEPLRKYISHPEFRWSDLARIANRHHSNPQLTTHRHQAVTAAKAPLAQVGS